MLPLEMREPLLNKMLDLISSHLGWKVGKIWGFFIKVEVKLHDTHQVLLSTLLLSHSIELALRLTCKSLLKYNNYCLIMS